MVYIYLQILFCSSEWNERKLETNFKWHVMEIVGKEYTMIIKI